jgi:hypothetical protein
MTHFNSSHIGVPPQNATETTRQVIGLIRDFVAHGLRVFQLRSSLCPVVVHSISSPTRRVRRTVNVDKPLIYYVPF